jgi:hypothetical protein
MATTELIVASVTIVPATITAVFTAYVGMKRLKRIGFAVNGQMDERFDRINTNIGDLSADIRELKAEIRDVKADVRDYRYDYYGDGK